MNDPNRTGPFLPETVDEVAAARPPRIGRYRVESILGEGSFGIVYLAHDEQLQRLVAVKMPHRKLVSRSEEAEAYLTEARTVATSSAASLTEGLSSLIFWARVLPSINLDTTKKGQSSVPPTS